MRLGKMEEESEEQEECRDVRKEQRRFIKKFGVPIDREVMR